MKMLFVWLLLLSPASSMASSGDLLFAEGPEEGQSALNGSIGYYEMCFTGSPFAVRNKTLDLIDGDIEKDAAFVRVDTKSDSLIISYVDTKCLDDSLDATPESCRVLWTVPRCK
jgi:hypothetical protein